MKDLTILDNNKKLNSINQYEELSLSGDYSEDEWNSAMCNR